MPRRVPRPAPKRKWLRRLLVAMVALGVLWALGAYLASELLVTAPSPYAPKPPDLQLGQAAVRAGPGELKKTTVTPVLDAPIEAGRNLLYCATAQLAWNELCTLAGGPVRLEGDPPAAAALNRQEFTRADLDEESLVAAAGFGDPAMAKRLRKEIAAKFGESVRPALLDCIETAPPGELVAYSCLFKGLPFEWAFDRRGSMGFAGKSVASWGIYQYTDCQDNEKRAAAQLHLHDYRNRDDFILETDTLAKEDQLVLAKVPSAPTLRKLVEAIGARMAGSKPETGMDDLADLAVPIIDFDVTHDFAELCGRRMAAASPKANGKQIAMARQNLRFRLDERGATLLSDVVIVTGIQETRHLVFDKPFLVMIRRRGARLPCFALWVDNDELLVRH